MGHIYSTAHNLSITNEMKFNRSNFTQWACRIETLEHFMNELHCAHSYDSMI